MVGALLKVLAAESVDALYEAVITPPAEVSNSSCESAREVSRRLSQTRCGQGGSRMDIQFNICTAITFTIYNPPLRQGRMADNNGSVRIQNTPRYLPSGHATKRSKRGVVFWGNNLPPCLF